MIQYILKCRNGLNVAYVVTVQNSQKYTPDT